ncbi:DNA-binding response regulator [Lachnospiraceae bacterium oral taxon 500]|nr:DNA-binding response regulator [Lachnospiraceae bacterium oral taxon 500]
MENKKRILIIEDDKNIANLEKDFLESNDFEVVIESDGLRGMKTALKGDFSLIIIDIMLPTVSGFDLLMTIRDKLDIPCLMVSARTDDIDKIKGLGLGADDYITKPFNPNELVARVKSQISRYDRLLGKDKGQEVLEVSGLRLIPESRKVFLNDKEVQLTTTEFDLLNFFMETPDIVHSKQKLFEKIWGEDEFGDINTVAVHIQKLRKKLEENPGKPKIIETVWGAGYRFNKF